MMALLVAAALMNPFVPGLALEAGPDEVEAALFDNGWTTQWYGLMFRGERPGEVIEFSWEEDGEEPVAIDYAEAHPPDETRTEAYETWLDKLTEIFGEPEAAVGFHHWETEKYNIHIVAEDYYIKNDFEPAVVITFNKKWDEVDTLGVEVADPFLPGLSLNEDTQTVLEALEEAGWAVDTRTDRSGWGHFFVLEGRQEGRLLRYAYEFTERLREVVYAEPHPPDETRTAAYRAWYDKFTNDFGEPEVLFGGFHRWKAGAYSIRIEPDDFDFGDGSSVPVVLITISWTP